MKTKEEFNAYQREYRRANSNSATIRYEKTVNGFLMRKYRNMQSRIVGIQWKKAHLYFGKELLTRDEFYVWAKNCKEFYDLWYAWCESNRDRKLCPTVDRIDSTKGYTVDNMRWKTHSENSRLGSFSRHRK